MRWNRKYKKLRMMKPSANQVWTNTAKLMDYNLKDTEKVIAGKERMKVK